MNDELKKIRKLYGEKLMQTCRSFFPQFLGKGDLVLNILTKYFAPTHSLYDDLNKSGNLSIFRDFVDSILYGNVEETELTETDKDPYTLMDEAGYTLHECESESEIQSYRHYYEPGEELCTFNGGRLNRCRVFFAVKKNVDEIKREDFSNPEREDAYGTSVISIQFTRTDVCALSIKNRYNHTVDNPDATFYNNLERIIPGLTRSFENLLGRKINTQVFESAKGALKTFLRRNYVTTKDDKFYRWNSFENEIFFCENNVLVVGDEAVYDFVNSKDRNRYLIINHIIIDLQKNKIFSILYDEKELVKTRDAFVKSIYDVGEIDRIIVNNETDGKAIYIKYTDGKVVTIKVDKNNYITEYENNYVTIIEDGFLQHANPKKITMNNVIEIGSYSLQVCDSLEELSIPNARVIKGHSFANVCKVKKLYFPELEDLGDRCFSDGLMVEEFYAPKLKFIGTDFLSESYKLHKIDLPSVRVIKDGFLGHYFYSDKRNFDFELSGFSNLEELGDNFLGYPEKLIIDPESMGIDYPNREVSLKEFYDILINQKNVRVNDEELEEHLDGGHRI